MRDGKDIAIATRRIAQVGLDSLGHLGNAFAPVRPRPFDICRPSVDLIPRNIVPRLQFPASEVDFHEPLVGIDRKVEQRTDLLRQRAASRERAGIDTRDGSRECIDKLTNVLSVESLSQDV